MREFCRHVFISFIWEKHLSIEAVETGNDKPIEAIFCKLGNIVTNSLRMTANFLRENICPIVVERNRN